MTKLTKILALLALLAAPVFAQEPPPGIKPEIKGPSLALPGQELRLNATGLTTPPDRKSTRLNSSHSQQSRMPSSA